MPAARATEFAAGTRPGAAPAAPAPQARACHGCGRDLESTPAAARLVTDAAGIPRAVEICRDCAGAGGAWRRTASAERRCARCDQPVSLAAGKPTIRAGASAAVELLCGACESALAASAAAAATAAVQSAAAAPVPSVRPQRAHARRVVTAVAGALALGGAAGLAWAALRSSPPPAAALLSIDNAGAASTTATTPAAALQVADPENRTVNALSLGIDDHQLVQLTWYHPLAGVRQLPDRPDRRFGAARPGNRPKECGLGHCGVDIGHVRGRVVHAARPGVVDRVVCVHDRMGGMYVRLRHAGGFYTYYMHLEAIRPGLVRGLEVAAGAPLGLLGRTGIHHSGPHLHFAVAKILPGGGQYFVDPEPMLKEAIVLDHPAPYPKAWLREKPSWCSYVPGSSPDEPVAKRRRGGDVAPDGVGAAAGAKAAADVADGSRSAAAGAAAVAPQPARGPNGTGHASHSPAAAHPPAGASAAHPPAGASAAPPLAGANAAPPRPVGSGASASARAPHRRRRDPAARTGDATGTAAAL